MSLTAAIVTSWHSPRAVLARLRAQDRHEGRLLMYLTLALILILVAQVPRLNRLATPEVGLDALLAGALFGLMFVGPLIFYGLALVLTLLLRIFGRVDGFAVRLALFWALLAVAPLVLAQAALVAVAGQGALALITGLGLLALFVAILIAGLRQALADTPRAA